MTQDIISEIYNILTITVQKIFASFDSFSIILYVYDHRPEKRTEVLFT